MRILAIDTSTPVSVVAIVDGAVARAEQRTPHAERHGEVLLPRVQAVLAQAGLALSDLDALAVGVGPGSFTGLRVGLATVKGLGFALQKPVRGVSSLTALAAAALAHVEQVVVLLDAFKGEVYAGVFRRGEIGAQLVGEIEHAAPAQAAARALERLSAGSALLIGDGVRRYPEATAAVLGGRAELGPPDLDVPSGIAIARIAAAELLAHGPSDLARLEPSYVRGSDAQLPARPLAVE